MVICFRRLQSMLYSLRVIAMATNFGTKIAIIRFVWTIANRELMVVEWGLSGRQTECRHCQYPAPKGRCHDNHVLAFYIWRHIGASWRIRLNRPCAAAMRPYVKLLWPFVAYLNHHCLFQRFCFLVLLWSPYGIGQTIIFSSCGFFLLSSFFFSSPNLSGRALDVYHTSIHGVALVRI